MKTLILLPVALMANCSATQIDPGQLDLPPAWSLVQERELDPPKEGDDLREKYDVCYADFHRLRDKHAITSRWIKTVTRPKS